MHSLSLVYLVYKDYRTEIRANKKFPGGPQRRMDKGDIHSEGRLFRKDQGPCLLEEKEHQRSYG